MVQLFDHQYHSNGQTREATFTYQNCFVKKEYYFASGRCSGREYSWNGIKHGNQIQYFPDGSIKNKKVFLNGTLVYLFNKQQIVEEVYIKKDKKESLIIYDNNGNIEREYYWNNKEHIDCNIYLKNINRHQQSNEDYYFDFIKRIDLDKTFYNFLNKTKTSTKIFIDDFLYIFFEHKNKRIYETTIYHKNGQLKSKVLFTKSKNRYSENVNPNEFFTYDENGEIVSHYFLKNNKYHGKCIVKNEFNDIDMEYDCGSSINGYETIFMYHEGVKCFRKNVYKNGIKIEESYDNFEDVLKNSYFEDFVRSEKYDKNYNLISCDVRTRKHYCLHIENREDLSVNLCKCCMPKELHDIYDKNVFICRHNFEDLEKNCPYYLEHIALK